MNDEYRIKAKEFKPIPEGKHTGNIYEVKLSETTKEKSYDYIDFIVTLDDKGFEENTIRFGVPANLSDVSKLGKLCNDSGFVFVTGKEYGFNDIKVHFEGKKISYKSVNIKGRVQKDVEFAEILIDTVEFL